VKPCVHTPTVVRSYRFGGADLTISTISTVGYGDFSPSSWGLRVFTMVYVLTTGTYIFFQLSELLASTLEHFRQACAMRLS
jgi:hypothetical protein